MPKATLLNPCPTRSWRVRHGAMAVVVLLALTACSGTKAEAPAASAPTRGVASSTTDAQSAAETPISVNSSLTGRDVLPQRVHWLGDVNAAAAKISEVDFLIDGTVAWVEHNPPYTYGDDHNWLVTSFLRPGVHTFTVRAISADGRAAQTTKRAKVIPPEAVPAVLKGKWTREVAPGEVQRDTPSGAWTFTPGLAGWTIEDPDGGGIRIDVRYLTASTLQLRPSAERPPYPNPRNGDFCEAKDAVATWALVVLDGGKSLRLRPSGTDRCTDRTGVFQGRWTRVGQ